MTVQPVWIFQPNEEEYWLEPVAKGAAFLDEKHPEWATKINISKLLMQHGHACILGQLYGQYDLGAVAVGLRNKDDQYRTTPLEDELGFHTTFTGRMPDHIAWTWLRRLWIAEVRKRTAA